MTTEDGRAVRSRALDLWISGVPTHAEIARRIGCSSERVRQVLGNHHGFNPHAALDEVKDELMRPIVVVIDPMVDEEKGFRHGTINARQYHKCRCFWCVEGSRAGYIERRGRNQENFRRGGAAPTHGKVSTYSVYGCRCAACVKANSVYNRAYKRRRKTSKRKGKR